MSFLNWNVRVLLLVTTSITILFLYLNFYVFRKLHSNKSINTGFVTRLTRRVSLVEQELPILPEHPSSPLVSSGVRVTRSSVLYVCFEDRCLSFFFWPLCSSSIYGFWLPPFGILDLQLLITSLWYLQTLLSAQTNYSTDLLKLTYLPQILW
jgi:hypothetical protein